MKKVAVYKFESQVFGDVVEFYNNMPQGVAINSNNTAWGTTESSFVVTELNWDVITFDVVKKALDDVTDGYGSQYLTVDYFEYDPANLKVGEHCVSVDFIKQHGKHIVEETA
jgi:hypothetical protein